MVKPFWVLGIDRQVQNILGASEYGLYFALFNFSLLFSMLLDFGLTNYNNRTIARHNQLLRKYFGSLLGLKLLLAVAYLLLLLCLAFILEYNETRFRLLGMLALNQILLSMFMYLRSNLSALQFFKTDSLLSVSDKSLMILFCGWILLFRPDILCIETFILCQTASYVLTIAIASILTLPHTGFVRPSFKPVFLRAILRQTYPYALLLLFMTFYYRLDGFMLDLLLPDQSLQAGIYAQAYRLLDAGSMFGLLFAALLLPMFAHQLKNKEYIQELLYTSFSMLLLPVVALSAFVFFYAAEICDMLYRHHTAETSVVLQVLMGSFVCISAGYIWGTLLTANGSMRVLNIVAFGGMLLNAGLNVLFIPAFGGMGAALASLCTLLLVIVAQIVLCGWIIKTSAPAYYWGRFAVYAFCICFALWLFKRFQYPPLTAFTVILIAAPALSFLLRLIRISDISSIFSFRRP